MPYPNEHACRLREPGDFKDDSFSRTERKHKGKPYSVIMGRLKNDDSMTEQAYRYKKDTWSESEAKSHCEDHDGKFEPAKKDSKTGAILGLPLLTDYITKVDWAIELGTLERLTDVIDRHLRGVQVSAEAIEQIRAGKKEPVSRDYEIIGNGVAVLPVTGIIAKYSRMVNDISLPAGTSVEKMRDMLDDALADRQVRAIVLRIESPGGVIDGVPDFVDRIYEASQQKPVMAYCDDLCTSAAYWLASQSQAIHASQGADVGSIGVYTLCVDSSKRAEQEGLKFHIFRSGPNKGVGSPGIKITKANQNAIQKRIDEKSEMFLSAVLRGRMSAGLDEKSLRTLADGRTYMGKSAVQNKLVDGICTWEQMINIAQSAEINERVTAIAMANSLKEKKMAEEKLEQEAAEKAKQAAVAERERISAISQVLSAEEFKDVREKAIAKEMSLDEAKAAAFDVATEIFNKKTIALQADLDKANEKLKAIVGGDSNITGQEPDDSQDESKKAAGKDDGRPETYEAAIEDFKAKGNTDGKAVALAAKHFPESHQAWVDAKHKAASEA